MARADFIVNFNVNSDILDSDTLDNTMFRRASNNTKNRLCKMVATVVGCRRAAESVLSGGVLRSVGV